MPPAQLCMCLALLAGCAACIERRAPSEGFVFAGPLDLPLHQDITPKSKVVVRARHGDKLFVIQQRRRLYKLRTTKGVEGWTDERNLMSADQMRSLTNLEEQARRSPSQGLATSYEMLNVHTEPQRYSPSFVQIAQGEKFDVIEHQTAARNEPAHRVLIKPQPKADSNNKKRSERKKFPAPPTPLPPKPPGDWLELSQEREPPPPDKAGANDADSEKEPVPTDDWTLVRTSRGVAGWVLTSRIYLEIPDEVAQYAEGHRITTYFSLGKIHDKDLNVDKDIWLWTTIRGGSAPYDFDSFRVFTWNPKRHRYETAYIQRTVEGYLPVLVQREGDRETFSVCLASDGGARARKRYMLLDRQIRAAGIEPCQAGEEAPSSPSQPAPSPEPEKAGSLAERLKRKAGEVKHRLTGK